MTKRFFEAAYARRKTPKEYDSSYFDRELARIAAAIPSAVKRAIQDLYPWLTGNNKNIDADVITTKYASVTPDPIIGPNRLEYTQQFDAGAWVRTTATVTPDSMIAPDGTLTADTLSAGAGGGYISLGRWTMASAVQARFSLYIKRMTTTNQTNFGIYDVTAAATVVEAACLWTGNNITSMATAGGAGAEYVFTSPADGWWRCSGLTNATLDPTHTYTFFIYPRNSGNSGSIYVWGAQVQAGALTNYVQVGAVYTALAVNGATDLGNTNITGSLTVSGAANFTPTFPSLTASQAVFTNASKTLVSVATTGTGRVVRANAPTITSPTITGWLLYAGAYSTTSQAVGPWTTTVGAYFATTPNGGTIQGCGPASDIALLTRAGIASLLVGPNTTNVTVVGHLSTGNAAVSATAFLLTPAGTTGVSSLRIPHGAAPSSPVDGDIWTTTAGIYVRINGVTVGPLT